MRIAVFDEFDAWGSFKECVEYAGGDKQYCRKAVELLAEAQAREEFVYGNKPRFRIILPMHMRRRYAMATDKNRRAVVIFIDAGASLLVLFYEDNNGEFKLKFSDWITPEVEALKNPHPTSFTLHL
jgi:hypothetical protein